MRYLLLGILYVVVYLAAGVLLAAVPVARMLVANTLLLALAAGICGIILARRRRWEGTQRLFWDTFGTGLAMWCVGEIGFTITALTGERSWVQWHTMFSLCGGIGPVVAMLARPYLGTRKSSVWAVGVDLVSYAMLLGFLYAYFVMVPGVVPTKGPAPQQALLALVQLQRFVLAAGLGWCAWRARGTAWRQTFILLAAGAGIGFFLRFLTSGAITAQRYQEGSFYDLAWIVPFWCYLWAANEAPRSTADDSASVQGAGWRSVAMSAAPVFLIPLIGFGLLRVQPIGEPGDSVRLLLTVLSTVAGLGLLTLRLSVQTGELQRADARIRMMAAATEQTADLILITRADGSVEHANDACVHALGYSRGELSTLTLSALLEPTLTGMVDRVGGEVRLKGIWRGTLVHRRRDGSTFPVSSTVVALRNGEGRITHFVGVQRDITEELRLRDQLVHSERLSAIGELVAGVAHEINNPLQTIIGCVELMIEERPPGVQRDLELVRQEATRAGQIVRNLLAFVRRGSPDRVPADLNELVAGIVQLREHHLSDRNVELRLELHDGALPVMVNREEIHQIVLNLLLNAEQALGEGGGTITVRTGAVQNTHTVQVIDDGPGLRPDVRGRVFEPFFTTKDVGQGTGLGLSIALGHAKAHGGTLELLPSSTGACFQLSLPAERVPSPPAALAVRQNPPASTAQPASGRRALVVENEGPIRALMARLLRRRGYEVTEAASCAEVMSASGAGPFDVVLCDVRLDDGNGGECLRQLRRADADVDRRFVFVTGDIGALTEQEPEFRDLAVLKKPFSATDLDRVLAELPVGVGPA